MGTDTLAQAVKSTLGPKGRNVALDKKWGAAPIHDDRLLSAALIAVYDDLARDGALPLGRAASALIPPPDPLSRLRF